MRLFRTIALVCAALVAFAGSTWAEGYGKQKVVYHINYDNPKAQAGALPECEIEWSLPVLA